LLFSGQLDPVFGVVGSPSPYFTQDGSMAESFAAGFGAVARGGIGGAACSVGGAIHYLNGNRDVSLLRIGTRQLSRMTLHAAVTTPTKPLFSKDNALFLNWLVRFEIEGPLRRLSGGAIAQYNAGHFGLLYHNNRNPFTRRNTQALSWVFGVAWSGSDAFSGTLQYAYDGVLSGLGQAATNGTHELTLTVALPEACAFRGRSTKGRVDCYDFARKGHRRIH
jgi:hypothetical protein